MATQTRKPREPADDRMAGFLREAQGWAIYLRLGVVTRDEVRSWLNKAHDAGLAELPEDFEAPQLYVEPTPAPMAPPPPSEEDVDGMDPAELLAHLGAGPVAGASLDGVAPIPGDDREGAYRPNAYEPLLRED